MAIDMDLHFVVELIVSIGPVLRARRSTSSAHLGRIVLPNVPRSRMDVISVSIDLQNLRGNPAKTCIDLDPVTNLVSATLRLAVHGGAAAVAGRLRMTAKIPGKTNRSGMSRIKLFLLFY